jgi:hypothetical protein
MQTFLPYADFRKSLESLDYRRLGKQRVEALQIVNALEGRSKGWVNHPATRMWAPYLDALKHYHNIAINVWVEKGYRNTMKHFIVPEKYFQPHFLGNYEFHLSHRSNLFHKSPADYPQFEMEFIPYVWPI